MSHPPENDLRVELRRYLGGIPFSHERELTGEERRALKKEVRPYLIVAGLFLIVGCGVIGTVFFRRELVAALVVMVGASLLSVPAYCLSWARPYLKALASGRVFSYMGRMHDIAAFDVAQAHYREKPEVRAHLDRYVEILAIGEGERIWRLEGIPNSEALADVRPVWLALVPDHDERGERALTPEEIRELRLRAKDFKECGPFLLRELMASFSLFLVYVFVRIGSGALALFGGAELWIAGFLWVLLSLVVWWPYFRRWKFAETLIRDAKTGTVRDGWLSSGLPWGVGGEPARWRVGRPKGGMNGVTKELAQELETAAMAARLASENASSAPASTPHRASADRS